jgi:hypothetical protein
MVIQSSFTSANLAFCRVYQLLVVELPTTGEVVQDSWVEGLSLLGDVFESGGMVGEDRGYGY